MYRGILSSSSSMAKNCRPVAPVIAVIGATGTGKSRLAIDLAVKFNGEVINCDALQLYEGLPVITNKVTEEEKRGVPHHLLGCIGLDQPTWTVGTFIPRALEKISEIREKGRLPVLVGGTHYYIQSLLMNDSTIGSTGSDESSHEPIAFLEEPTPVLIEKLREVDPIMADRWHPNERRKIQRSLEIWFQTGKPASELYAKQLQSVSTNNETNYDPSGGFDSLVFWINTPKDILQRRLDARVGAMLEHGLLDEVGTLSSFQARKSAEGDPVDMSKGIGVAIGYKEFLDYIAAVRRGDAEDKVKSFYEDAVERTKISTRQYANRQLKWIKNKLLSAMDRKGTLDHLFVLTNCDALKFEVEVEDMAQKLTGKFLDGAELPPPESLSQEACEILATKGSDLSKDRNEWMRRICETCNVTTVTKGLWEEHERSNRHRKAIAAIARRKRLESEGRLEIAS